MIWIKFELKRVSCAVPLPARFTQIGFNNNRSRWCGLLFRLPWKSIPNRPQIGTNWFYLWCERRPTNSHENAWRNHAICIWTWLWTHSISNVALQSPFANKRMLGMTEQLKLCYCRMQGNASSRTWTNSETETFHFRYETFTFPNIPLRRVVQSTGTQCIVGPVCVNQTGI